MAPRHKKRQREKRAAEDSLLAASDDGALVTTATSQTVQEKGTEPPSENGEHNTTTQQGEEEFDWAKSAQKRLLLKLLRDGTIPLTSKEMKPRDVFESRPEFVKLGYSNWTERLRRARKKVIDGANRKERDAESYEQSIALFPLKATNSRGLPRWEGSQAEASMYEDVKHGRHKGMRPKDFKETRAEYRAFPCLSTFRNHIYQTERTIKFGGYVEMLRAEGEDIE